MFAADGVDESAPWTDGPNDRLVGPSVMSDSENTGTWKITMVGMVHTMPPLCRKGADRNIWPNGGVGKWTV